MTHKQKHMTLFVSMTLVIAVPFLLLSSASTRASKQVVVQDIATTSSEIYSGAGLLNGAVEDPCGLAVVECEGE